MRQTLALALCLIGAFALAWWNAQPPRALGSDAPVGVFSAGRAMVDDRVIAREPHPVGSKANAAVRDHLVHRMSALGLSPQVQRTDAIQRIPRAKEPLVVGAIVENVVGVLPGADRSAPALAIMAHYDSVPGSPGAADDAAGVSAGLEVMRILKARGTPARDVILLITDGEEAGLLGAVGFFRDQPLARHIGFVINMETRGGGGPVQMFQTGAENGEVIQLFAKSAVRPQSSSLAVFLYEHMPNDTDFTVSKAAGLTGLNYAFIGRQFDYHAATSTSDNLDQGSLQHMGDQILATAQDIAFRPSLPGKAANVVYANTFGSHVLIYPQIMGWPVLLLASALISVGVWRARAAGVFVASDVARGASAAIYLLVTAAAAFRLARHATGAGIGFFEQRLLLAQVTRWEIALALIGTGLAIYAANVAARGGSRFQAGGLALLAGAGCCAFGFDDLGLGLGVSGSVIALLAFGKPSGVAGAWTGALVTALTVAIAAQVLAAPTAFLIAWPLTVAGLAGAVSAMGSMRSTWVNLPLSALLGVTLGWVLGFGHGVFQGLDLVELLAVFTWLGGLMVWPLVQDEDRFPRLAGLGLLLAGFLVVALVRYLPPWTARHPQASFVSYRLDLDTGKASRVSLMARLDPWSKAVLTADGGAVHVAELPMTDHETGLAASAKPLAATGAALTLTPQSGGGFLLRIVPPVAAREFGLDIRSDTVVQATTVNGRPLKLFDKPGQWSRLRFSAMPEGFVIGFKPVGPGGLEARYSATAEAWPTGAVPLPPRDAKTMAFDVSDSTVVVGSKQFTW